MALHHVIHQISNYRTNAPYLELTHQIISFLANSSQTALIFTNSLSNVTIFNKQLSISNLGKKNSNRFKIATHLIKDRKQHPLYGSLGLKGKV